MKTDAIEPTQLVQYKRDFDKEDNEISKKVSDENICNNFSDISVTDGFIFSFTNDKVDVLRPMSSRKVVCRQPP